MATATAMANRIRNKVKLMAIHVAYNLPHSNSARTVPRNRDRDRHSLWQTETESEPIAGINGKAKANSKQISATSNKKALNKNKLLIVS